MITRVFLALVFIAANAAAPDQGAPPPKPAVHGSLLNGGMFATVEVQVVGCQGWPVGVARALLVGEREGEDRGDGLFVFEEVAPGAHRLYVYADGGSTSDSELVVSDAAAVIRAEVMLDICVETELTIFKGVVTAANGKPAAGATVAVPALFLETTADKKGRYALALPPGEWEIEVAGARAGGSVGATVLAGKPEDHWDASPVEQLDLRLQ